MIFLLFWVWGVFFEKISPITGFKTQFITFNLCTYDKINEVTSILINFFE